MVSIVMASKPKRPTLRISFNQVRYDNLSAAARKELRQATIDAMMDEAKDG